jgi:hypothetical protein
MSLKPYPLSHPIGAAEKVRQLTRIRMKIGLRVEYTNNTTEADVMRKGKKVAILKKEKMYGREIWAAYSVSGKRMGFAEIGKLKDLLKQIAKSV